MKFEKGNKAAKGGLRNPPGGRPTKEQQEIKKQAAEIAKEFIETHVQDFLDSYLDLGKGKVIEQKNKAGKRVKVKFIPADPATVRHFVDKVLPDEQKEDIEPVRPIYFLQFNAATRTVEVPPAIQLPAEGLPNPVSRNAGGDQKSKEYAAPLIAYRDAKENAEQGQLEKPKPQQVKFHAFAFSSGNGKRRE